MTAREDVPFDTETPADETIVLDATTFPERVEPTTTAVAIASVRSQALAPLSFVDQALADLTKTYKGATYAVSTTEGMEKAIAARRVLRETRLKVGPIVKTQKAELKLIASALETEGDRIIGVIEALETPIGKQIKDEEDRKAAAKIERERLEAEASKRTQAVIDSLRNALVTAVGKTAVEIKAAITEIDAIETSVAAFGDRAGEVMQTKMQTLDALDSMHAAAVVADRDRAELEALRASQAEKDRIAAEEKAAADKIEADRLEADRLRNEKIAADALAAQQLTITAMAEITRIQGLPGIAAREPSLVAIEAVLDEVSKWEPTAAAFGFLLEPAQLAKTTTIAQLNALALKTVQDNAAALALAEQAAADKRAADAAQKLIDDKAEADRLKQVEADAEAAKQRIAASLALKKAQEHAAELAAALRGMDAALESLTDGDNELSCIPEGPERSELLAAWDIGRAALFAIA